jgi:hypothetical protein
MDGGRDGVEAICRPVVFVVSSFIVATLQGANLTQEAKYVESWPNTTSAWAGWRRFDFPVDRYGGVHSQLNCTSMTLGSPTCH